MRLSFAVMVCSAAAMLLSVAAPARACTKEVRRPDKPPPPPILLLAVDAPDEIKAQLVAAIQEIAGEFEVEVRAGDLVSFARQEGCAGHAFELCLAKDFERELFVLTTKVIPQETETKLTQSIAHKENLRATRSATSVSAPANLLDLVRTSTRELLVSRADIANLKRAVRETGGGERKPEKTPAPAPRAIPCS